MNDILQWSKTVDSFVQQYGRRMPQDKRDDLRQDIYVALLDYQKPLDEELVVELAMRVVDTNHLKNIFELRYSDQGKIIEQDLNLEVREAIDSLSVDLQELAFDLFFEGLSQTEAAKKHHKSQWWVSTKRTKILKSLKNYFKTRVN